MEDNAVSQPRPFDRDAPLSTGWTEAMSFRASDFRTFQRCHLASEGAQKKRNRVVFLVGLALLVVEFPLALAFRAPGIKEGPLVRTKDRVDSIRQALLNRLALRPPFLS